MSNKAKSGKRPTNTVQKEDVIQAVVIADSFSVRFAPITQTKPRVLLPLVNTPLLDYTLEFLGTSGVQEVFLFCCSHADQIKDHVKKSKWNGGLWTMTVTVIVSEGARSLGDALRDLDAKAVIRSDFILLYGDVVSNVQLLPILEHHKKLQKQDRGAVMTLVYKRAPPGHKSRSLEDETVLAVNADTNRVLYHRKVAGQKKVTFPLETFLEWSTVDVRYDLLDPHISICSPAVPPLFSDNFDFQTRDDFIKGLLINEEILGSTIYWHCLEDEYAARVSSLQMYHAVSRDVMHRWVFPLVPDLGISSCSGSYIYLRNNIYRQKDVTLSKGCVFVEDVVIGEGTSIGENTEVTQSVIGRNCKIGRNVFIENSYIWNNVTIEDNCKIQYSILANDVTLKHHVVLESNCILGSGVIIGPDITQKDIQLVASPIEEKHGFSVEKPVEFEMAGEKAYVYKPPADSDSEDEGQHQQSGALAGLRIMSEEEDEDSDHLTASSDRMSERMSPVPDDTNIFFNEVLDSLIRGYEEKLVCDNLILEINSSRYAYNVTVKEVNYLVMKAILSIPTHKSGSVLNTKELLAQLKPLFLFFLPILQNYVKNGEAQADCLESMEDFVSNDSTFGEVLKNVLHLLYVKDILNEDAILEWYRSAPEDSTTSAGLRKQVTPFIEWLKDAEEESESGSESESS